MKIAIMCESILLQESLKIFLNRFITNYKNAEIVISDKQIETLKPLFLISNSKNANLSIPFTNMKLQMQLEKFYNEQNGTILHKDTLESALENLIKEYTQQLLTIVKNHS